MNILVPHFNRYHRWMSDFDQLFDSTETSLQTANSLAFSADIEEHDDYVLLSFDLPGMKEEDLAVKVEGEQLFISGERKREETRAQKNQNQLLTQRRYGKFQKIYTLPESIDAKKIEADYRDGVLSVYLPKIEVKKADVIDVPVRGKGKDTFLDRLLGSVSQQK
jgi:HSP20 family protein